MEQDISKPNSSLDFLLVAGLLLHDEGQTIFYIGPSKLDMSST